MGPEAQPGKGKRSRMMALQCAKLLDAPLTAEKPVAALMPAGVALCGCRCQGSSPACDMCSPDLLIGGFSSLRRRSRSAPATRGSQMSGSTSGGGGGTEYQVPSRGGGGNEQSREPAALPIRSAGEGSENASWRLSRVPEDVPPGVRRAVSPPDWESADGWLE